MEEWFRVFIFIRKLMVDYDNFVSVECRYGMLLDVDIDCSYSIES